MPSPTGNKIFKYISSIKGCETFPAKMYYIDKSASTDLEKAQLFNDYFCSVFSSPSDLPSSVSDPQSRCINFQVQDILLSDSDILYELSSLDDTKLVELIISVLKFSNFVQDHYI